MEEIRSIQSDVKIRNRLAAHRRKFGSPDFKDILRQKCRARMKSKRGNLFDQLRSFDSEENMKIALATILDHDINSLSICNETDDLMDTEVCDEPNIEEKWILDEYERLMETNIALIELEQQVVCPMCEKGVLQYSPHHMITCTLCTLMLPSKVTLGQLEHLIIESIDNHGSVCQNKPQFTVIPDNNSTCLLLVCCSCNYVYVII